MNSNGSVSLSEHKVDIWHYTFVSNFAHISKYLRLLSRDEIQRAKKFKFQIDRERYIIARAILRILLGKYTDQNPTNIRFKYTSYGKPYIENKNNLKFNISHSGDKAVFGFNLNNEVGIDIEKLKGDFDVLELAQNFFSKTEIAALKQIPKDQLSRAFYRCWTRKEAFIKAKGSGLSFPLNKFAVSLDDDNQAALLKTKWDASEKSDWSLFSFVPDEQYIGAVATRNRKAFIEHYDWDSEKNNQNLKL